MTAGIWTMLTYSASSLDSLALYEHTEVPLMVRELVQYGWMTWHAQVVKPTCMIADTVDGATMTALTAEMPVWDALMDPLSYVWWTEVFTLAVLRFTSVDSGEQCVMTTGIWERHMWCVANWATPVLPTLLTLEHSVVALVVSGWMMSIVEEESRRYLSVAIVDGEVITVAIGKMQGWSVESKWLEMIPKRFDYYFLGFFFRAPPIPINKSINIPFGTLILRRFCFLFFITIISLYCILLLRQSNYTAGSKIYYTVKQWGSFVIGACKVSWFVIEGKAFLFLNWPTQKNCMWDTHNVSTPLNERSKILKQSQVFLLLIQKERYAARSTLKNNLVLNWINIYSVKYFVILI